jgi:signal transduction histidine kinase
MSRSRSHPEKHPKKAPSSRDSTSDVRSADVVNTGIAGREHLPSSAAPAPVPVPASTPAPWLPATLPVPAAGPDYLEVLATLRHEFFTPLTVIGGYTSTLLDRRHQLASDEQTEFLQVIQHAGRRLEHLTQQLLELAELEAGLLGLDSRPVEIAALARTVLAHVEDQVPEPLRGRFAFFLRCRDALGQPTADPFVVTGDEHRLRQVLEQLVENAIQYSPMGGRIDVIVRPAPGPPADSGDGPRLGPRLELGPGSEGHAADTPFVEVCVCDVGTGIPEEELERIFLPFYRLDRRLTRERYGLGLGLAACKQLVSLHHGHLWAESCPDGGSAFHVWLPLEQAFRAPEKPMLV